MTWLNLEWWLWNSEGQLLLPPWVSNLFGFCIITKTILRKLQGSEMLKIMQTVLVGVGLTVVIVLVPNQSFCGHYEELKGENSWIQASSTWYLLVFYWQGLQQSCGLQHLLYGIPAGPPLGSALVEKLNLITSWLLLPLYFVKDLGHWYILCQIEELFVSTVYHTPCLHWEVSWSPDFFSLQKSTPQELLDWPGNECPRCSWARPVQNDEGKRGMLQIIRHTPQTNHLIQTWYYVFLQTAGNTWRAIRYNVHINVNCGSYSHTCIETFNNPLRRLAFC